MQKLKVLMYCFIFICLSLFVCSETTYHITNLDMCDNEALVKVRPNNNSVKFQNCNYQDELWHCKCKKNLSIDMLIKDNVSNEYDVVVQYYLNKNLENSMRKLEFNNIIINNKKDIKKGKLNLPSFETGRWIFILIFVIVLFVGSLILGIRKFIKDDDKDNDEDYVNKVLDEIDK
jgi:hypothetical protein